MDKKAGGITREESAKRAKKQITMVIVVGLMLIAADLIISINNGVSVENSYGQLYLVRPEADEGSGHLALKAVINDGDVSYEKRVNVMIEPYESQKREKKDIKEEEEIIARAEEEKIEYDLRSIADSINADKTAKKVMLPEKLESGEKITWKVEKDSQTNTFIILIIMASSIFLIYRERYTPLKKIEARNRDSVIRQLPGFINRLILLLNAGMVLNSAFQKAVEESIGTANSDDDYFYKNMRGIYVSVKTANGSMNEGLRAFAKKSGVRQLMRVSNIINDNISKGTELTEKLQSEAEMLWMERKKRCEEMGKLAETKLTVPLMLFLVVLIVITITPALLGL